MERTECYTYFVIKGVFDPSEITTLLKLQPQKCWSIGQKRKNGIDEYNFALWEYGRQDNYDVDVYKQCLDTIAELKDKIPILQQIRTTYDAQYTLEIVPTIAINDTTPAIYFEREIIKFCYLTNTIIDIDMYVNS